MNRRFGFFRFLLIGFLVMGLFSMMRNSAYRSGWMAGYENGQVATQAAAQTAEAGAETEADEAVSAPQATPHRHYGGGFFSPFFWIIGGMIKFVFFFMFMGFLFKLSRFGRWKRWQGHKHRFHKEWSHHQGSHTPPWYDDSGDEPVMKA